jgi:hypothetical protein
LGPAYQEWPGRSVPFRVNGCRGERRILDAKAAG